MRHHHTVTDPGDHYAANVSGGAPLVLAQLQHVNETGHVEQVRVVLTPGEARHFAQLLTQAAARAEADQ